MIKAYSLGYLLFFFYLVIACWLLTKLKIVRSTSLGSRTIILLFLLRIAAGLVYGYVYSLQPDYLNSSDTWRMFTQSVSEYKQALHQPGAFFESWFSNPYHASYTNFFGSTNSYWNNLRDNIMVKTEVIMNLFSFGNYYVDIIFYNFIAFFGSICFFRVLQYLFPGKNKAHIVSAFLIPSFLFWTSGMHKDGYIFLLIAIILFNLVLKAANQKARPMPVIYIMLCFAGIFLFRNYVALLLLPALAVWIASNNSNKRSALLFPAIYLVMGIFIFVGKEIHPSLNFPAFIAERQHEFLSLPANSNITVEPLDGSSGSLLRHTPQAIETGFFRPFFFENKGLMYTAFAIELTFFWLLFLLFVTRIKYVTATQGSFFSLCICFTFSCWLFLGFTVPVLGALVRYKSIFLPLLVGPMLGLLFKSKQIK